MASYVHVRIGVSGHRAFSDEPSVARVVRSSLAKIRRDAAHRHRRRPVRFTVVSALADGADRLVAQELLKDVATTLEVSLPLPPDSYMADFPGRVSKAEFDALLAQAVVTREAPSFETREEAYEWAGRDVVERCHLLLALWDGQPSRGRGGTAEIVEYARQMCVPVWWINTSVHPPVLESHPRLRSALSAAEASDDGLTEQARRDLKSFEHAVETASDATRTLWLPPDPDAYRSLCVEALAEWAGPNYAIADGQARGFQRRYQRASALIFALAALAVTAVAIQDVYLPAHPVVAAAELVFLALLASTYVFSRRLGWHDRWISCRYLAERLRSAFFLAVARDPPDRERTSIQVNYSWDPDEVWIKVALDRVAKAKPRLTGEPDVVELRRYLASYWIGGQAEYHCSASSKQHRLGHRAKWFAIALFILAVAVAIMHVASVGERADVPHVADTVVFLAIIVPAIGAAIHGIEGQREYDRHAERYIRMAGLLRQLRHRMDHARDLAEVQEICTATERVIREENGDWFGVMRFHDVDLIS